MSTEWHIPFKKKKVPVYKSRSTNINLHNRLIPCGLRVGFWYGSCSLFLFNAQCIHYFAISSMLVAYNQIYTRIDNKRRKKNIGENLNKNRVCSKESNKTLNKITSHAIINGSMQVRQAKCNGMINQVSNSKATHISAIYKRNQREQNLTKTEQIWELT